MWSGVVLAWIIYEALVMKDDLKEMPQDSVLLGIVEEQREETHWELQSKAQMEGLKKKEKGKENLQVENKIRCK